MNNIKLPNIFGKGSIIYVCQGSEYVFEYVQDAFEKNEQIIFSFHAFSSLYALIS